MTPEGKIKALINHVLTKHGCWSFMPVPTGYQGKTVDYLVCHRGRFIAIEAKRPGKGPTSRQAYILRLIREAGGVTFSISTPQEVGYLDAELTAWEATSGVTT
jgi:hypothetical protein